VASIDDAKGWHVCFDNRLSIRKDFAFKPPNLVVGQHAYAVAVDPTKISLNHQARHQLLPLNGQAPSGQNGFNLSAEEVSLETAHHSNPELAV
jgi:hypothetical protein